MPARSQRVVKYIAIIKSTALDSSNPFGSRSTAKRDEQYITDQTKLHNCIKS